MQGDLLKYAGTFKGKSVFFLGAGVSHRPLVPLFARAGARVTVCDRLERSKFDSALYDEFSALGVAFCLGEDYLSRLSEADVVFRSPGISSLTPEIAAAGQAVTSEMEQFFSVCPCKIIGITGSDGKTTTSTLIAEILRAEGRRVHLGGNIGVPLLPELDGIEKDDIAVVELSSFQLMSMKRSPHIAVLTNIATNHLDYHKDMDEYIGAKLNIFRQQTPECVAVLNEDDARTAEIVGVLKADIRTFSIKHAVDSGAYFAHGDIMLSDGTKVLSASELIVPGMHNIANFACACAAISGLAKVDAMRKVGRSFVGVEHRIEFVRELSGVKYYNDSIATTPTRTVAGLRSFDRKLVLIAGGYDKNIPLEPMIGDIMQRVKLLILTGATAEKIEKLVETNPNYDGTNPRAVRVDDLEQAVRMAKIGAADGDIVLFSPACASFDHFRNFEQRGEYFKKLVLAL